MNAESPYTKQLTFVDQPVRLISGPPGSLFDVNNLIKNPEEFRAKNTLVHAMVDFGGIFEGLVGRDTTPWEIEGAKSNGMIALEDYYPKARELATGLGNHALQAIRDSRFYANQQWAEVYRQYVQDAYSLLNSHAGRFGADFPDAARVSFVRAGAVCTRLEMGRGQDEEIAEEVLVNTKRVHPQGSPDTHLAVTVKWYNPDRLAELVNDQPIVISDTVLASGASAAAFVLACVEQGIKPAMIIFKTVLATQQGMKLLSEAMKKMDIRTFFYTLARSREMNPQYYLVGDNEHEEPRVVGDAGDALDRFLPQFVRSLD
ncbi:hypothetical protein HY214_04540 [Candidatus Roizmanbacteria bacterium]|nr:hypothetical protein [Candidatus Roizmanbacteria bacterium]